MYPSYPAAGSRAQEDRLTVESLEPQYVYVSSAVGGSISQVSLGDNAIGSRVATTHSRGIRGKIEGFSRGSRRNLLRKLASINRDAFRAYKGRLIAIGLTYPSEYPEDPELCKRHLEALHKRLKRIYGSFSGFWRLGIQQRGAWHFHLLLFVPHSFGKVKELRHFIASSWYEICGRISEGHLVAGIRVEEVKNWRKATSYVEKYVAKRERFPEGVETGRVWGVWNEEMLPVRWETVKVSLKDAYRIRRIYRRLAKIRGRGRLCRLTVFIQHENVLRLLEFLGYRQEE
jgi:hypothetical protein